MKPLRSRRLAGHANTFAGFSLIELMIAMTIGLVMIVAAGVLFAKARDIYRTMETTARMQENARYAMSIIETDVRMANFWGLLSRPDLFSNTASSASPLAPAVTNNCGATSAFVTDLDDYIEGSNNSFALSCNAYGAGVQGGTDVLIIRRASSDRAPQTAAGISALKDSLLIESARSQAQIFLATAAGTIPAGYAQADVSGEPPRADTRRLIVNAYYVSQDSSVGTGYPSLRRKTLIKGPAFQDEEVIPGVEDLQFQLGVDVNDDRNADVFVNAGSVPAGGLVVAVRIWLRVRAQERDVAHEDTQSYAYADLNQAALNDQYRRLVVMQTVQLRNTRS
jgi:type IV pilus assembly protein PilW